jgi:hypothetical protein
MNSKRSFDDAATYQSPQADGDDGSAFAAWEQEQARKAVPQPDGHPGTVDAGKPAHTPG